MAISREIVRDALVALLTTEMIGVDKAQTVREYKSTIEGKAPLVYVRSAGTFRKTVTFEEDLPQFRLDVLIYTHRAKGAWTDAMACDMVDKLESLLADVVQTYRETATWDSLEYARPSIVEEMEFETGGNRYYKETIPLLIKIDSI